MKKRETLTIQTKGWINVLLIVAYISFAYFLTNRILDSAMPRFIPTESSASDFWWFGATALIFGCAAFALFKGAGDSDVDRAVTRVMKAFSMVIECLIFIGAIALWIEANQYATWVGQFEPIIAGSGVDARYWIASVLFLNGISGNLVAALLLS